MYLEQDIEVLFNVVMVKQEFMLLLIDNHEKKTTGEVFNKTRSFESQYAFIDIMQVI